MYLQLKQYNTTIKYCKQKIKQDKMKTTAIICEFNPLHSGHKRLIDYAKTFSDKVICIMSGNFTQRGLPACCDKYSRAKHALLAGADLVVELPTVFATASAENFAYGGVAIANQLDADYLLFGSECGNIDEITNCAHLLLDEEINRQIANEVKTGVSYPKAVANAVNSSILDKPNNVLAVEYVKALVLSKSTIKPLTITREDNYNGEPSEYASSSSLRTGAELRTKYTYQYVITDIDDNIERKFGEAATSILSLKSPAELRNTEGVSEGIENRICAVDKSQGYEKMLEQIKTKRYTRLRLQRIILNAILNADKKDVMDAKNSAPAIKPLAVKTGATALLSKTNGEVDELTQRADRLFYSLTNTKPPLKLIKLD